MRDEQSLRRPGFRDGQLVRLADGRDWVLPAPVEDALEGHRASGFDTDYEAVVTAVAEAQDAGERRLAELCLAIHLLGRNYELAPADYRDLLEFPAGDPGLAALQSALHGVGISHVRALARCAASPPPSKPHRRLASFVAFVAGR